MTVQPSSNRSWLVTRAKPAAVMTASVIATIWILEIIDTASFHILDQLGIRSWDFLNLWSLLTAPFIHFGFYHLATNTSVFVIVGFLVALAGLKQWLKVAGITALSSGLFAFFLNPPGVITAGLSGVIFGFLTFLIVRGFYSRLWWQIVMGFVLFLSYGGVLWGVLPLQAGVSWQGHLGGAVGGVMAAWLLHRTHKRLPQ